MINFTKRYVNTVSFIISIIIFCFLNNNFLSNLGINSESFFIFNRLIPIIQERQQEYENLENQNIQSEEKVNEDLTKENSNEELKKTVNWQIEIPKINLKATIAEGTTKGIMDEFVGHFEETAKDKGNVGLAAHNRGYKVNYFHDLKKLEEGDEIIYIYGTVKRRYLVKVHEIIKDTDWSLLENTEENKITLITCVENEPEYRRCIQAVENI
ncbi:MAG: class D sortase [Clostridia bacterium]|nr:class D sortase [Clostridia bacterium]